ncbi:MAG: FtsX-like permease family protein [Actinomycetota bacterium]
MASVRTLQGLGGRLVTERRGRTALTTAGITLGVALFTGALIMTMTSAQGMADFAAETNGQADVMAAAPGASLASIVSPTGGELRGGVVDELAALAGVDVAFGLLVAPSSFEGPLGATSLRVNRLTAAALVGTDLEEGRTIFPVELSAGRLPADAVDEIALPPRLADRLGARLDETITVSTSQGPRAVRVVGILADRGIGRLDRIGFTSLSAAQRMAGQPDVITQVALSLEDDIDVGQWIAEHEDLAPDGVVLSTPSNSLRALRAQIAALNGSLIGLGAGLLFTAGFLIYLTLAMSVVERTRLYGTMLALGATHRQVRKVVLAEALVIGAIGTSLGLALGLGVAAALRAGTGRLLSLFGDPGLVVSPWALAAGAAVGVGTTLVSALVPSRRAAATDPVAAIRTTAADEPLPSGTWLVAAGLLVAGFVTLTRPGVGPAAVGLVLVLVGAVRLVPFVIAPLAGRLGPLVALRSRGGGRLAIQHLVAERTRSAYTLALVMLVMTLAVAIMTIYLSFTSSLERQLSVQFGDALHVTAASTFEPSFVDALRDVPGVAAVTARSRATTSFTTEAGTEDIYMGTIDPATYFDVATFAFVDGTVDGVVEAFEQGDSVILPASTADRLGVGLGDGITLGTLEGPMVFTIAATAELSNVPALFVTSNEIGLRRFGAVGISDALVRVDPATSPTAVRNNIQAALDDRATFIVTTASELKADTRAQIAGGANSFLVLLFLAGIVGTFGLANTMAVSVTKRYREIGVLRAMGARRRQIRGMAIVEALTLVAVALVLAFPLGMLVSKPLLAVTLEQLGDISVGYSVPWAIFPILLVIAAGAAVIAAAWPARRASRLEIDAALRFE